MQLGCVFFIFVKKLIMNNIKLILSEHNISNTKFRTNLLNLFYSSERSLSVEDILNNFNSSINKVTIYRCLADFEKKGLIHKVPDNNNLKRYALCNQNECNSTSHSHNHGHFICYSCNQTFCLDKIKVPDTSYIKGFYVKELKLTAEGYCSDCYKN